MAQNQIISALTGSMNMDIDPSFLPEGNYVMANNMRIGFSEKSNMGCGENIKGTLEIENANLVDKTGRYKVIGAVTYEPNSVAYFFMKDTRGIEHMICELNIRTKAISLILKGDLKFSKRIITARYFNDMLIWNDTETDLRCIFISLAKSGAYPFTDYSTTTLIKSPPDRAITFELFNSDPLAAGLIGPNQYQFIYRYVFVGNQRSVWSVPSKVCAVPDNTTDYIRLFLNATQIAFADLFVNFIQYIEIGFRDDDSQPYRFFKRIKFPSVRAASFYVDFYNNAQYPTIATSETLTPYSDNPLRCADFTIGDNRILTGNNTYGFNEIPNISATQFEATRPTSNTPVDNGVYFLQGGQYNVGVALYDEYDRRSFVYDLSAFKVLPRNGSMYFTKVEITLTGKLAPWVKTWRPLLSKCANKGDFIQAHITVITANGTTLEFSPTFISPTPVEFAWAFTTGDKFSLLTQNTAGDAHTITIADKDLTYDTVGAKYVVTGFDFTGVTTGALIEIYSPIKSALIGEYYEIGETFPVYVAPNGDKYFGNSPANGQSFVINGGDTFYKTAQDAQTRNMNNATFDTWFRNIGRANIISQDVQMEVTNPSEIAFSDQYLQGTKVNGLNSFNFASKQVYGLEFGDIKRIVIARDFQSNGSVLLVVTQNNCYSVYLGKVQYTSTDGSSQIGITNQLLGNSNLLAGGFGTLNPESVHVFGTTVRGWDALKGVIWRYSNDGLTPLSKEYGANSYCSHLADSISDTTDNENQTAISAYDPYFDEYLVCIRDSTKDQNPTIAFNETKNGFSTFYDFDPDCMVTLNRSVVSWKNGVTYIHRESDTYNHLQGQNVKSSVTCVVKASAFDTLNGTSLWAYAQDKWELEAKGIERTGTKKQQKSETIGTSIEQVEDVWRMPIKPDSISKQPMKSRYLLAKLTLDGNVDYMSVLYGIAVTVSDSPQNPTK